MFSLAWLEMLILIPVLLCAWEAAYRLDVIGGFDGTGRRLLTCVLVGLLAGWLVIMFAVSLPELGRSLLGRGVTDAVWHSLWLALIPIAALAWLFASKVSRNVWFFAALGWGLLGIAANNWLASETHGLAIAAIIVGLDRARPAIFVTARAAAQMSARPRLGLACSALRSACH